MMKITVAAATLLIGAVLTAQASPGDQGRACIAKVIHSEELPFAPVHYWLVRVRLEITPPGGRAFEVVLEDQMPWQGPPPRRGQTFRVLCDPANPSDLRTIYSASRYSTSRYSASRW
jgi:hypothetical protein